MPPAPKGGRGIRPKSANFLTFHYARISTQIADVPFLIIPEILALKAPYCKEIESYSDKILLIALILNHLFSSHKSAKPTVSDNFLSYFIGIKKIYRVFFSLQQNISFHKLKWYMNKIHIIQF